MIRPALAAALAAALLLAGCSSRTAPRPWTGIEDPPPAAPAGDRAPAPAEAIPGPRVLAIVPGDPPAPAAASGESLVKPGDTLDVSVFAHPELSRVVPVQPDGSIAFPFLGRLEVKGRTVDAIAKEIAAALERDYSLREPMVSIAVNSFAARAVYVLGRVRQSGSHDLPLTRPLTLLQLVSLAGGFEEDADRSRVLVQRTRDDGSREVLSVDLRGVERDADLRNDIPLRDADTVFVPRADEVSVLGQVTKPGSFVIRGGRPLTLLRAIARVEGFTRLAKPSSVYWIRSTPAGVRTVTVDAEAIVAGAQKDPEIAPGDVIFVPERAW